LFRPWDSSGVALSVQRKWSFRLRDSLFNRFRLIMQAKQRQELQDLAVWNRDGEGAQSTAWRFPPLPAEAFLPRFNVDGGLEVPEAEWPDLARLEPMSMARSLREVLSRMDENARAAFVLCDLVELPVEDAAQIVQSSPQVVRRRAHDARLMLRGSLERLWSV
jgi:DNA-directed RNA polymerase specialized sigma24 family protein